MMTLDQFLRWIVIPGIGFGIIALLILRDARRLK
jgi:hypothetical protein